MVTSIKRKSPTPRMIYKLGLPLTYVAEVGNFFEKT